jgi:hypothetical protein
MVSLGSKSFHGVFSESKQLSFNDQAMTDEPTPVEYILPSSTPVTPIQAYGSAPCLLCASRSSSVGLGKTKALSETIQNKLLPILRLQPGFVDEITGVRC